MSNDTERKQLWTDTLITTLSKAEHLLAANAGDNIINISVNAANTVLDAYDKQFSKNNYQVGRAGVGRAGGGK